MKMKSKTKTAILCMTTQLLILTVCLLSSFFCDVEFSIVLKYFLLQFATIYLPGLAFHLKTIGNRNDIVSLNLYPYAYGIPVLMLEYLVWALIKIQNMPFVLFLIVTITSTISICKDRERIMDIEDDNSYLVLLLFFLLSSVICFFSVSLSNPLPTVFGETAYNKDFLFWVGNSISFTKGLPVQNFRLVGMDFHYHYFSNILIAQLSLISKLDIWTLSYYFTYTIPCLMMVLSAYRLFRCLVDNRLLIYVGMITLLYAEGSTVFLVEHLYFNPFGFDYAYAYAMLQIEQIIYMYKENDFSIIEIVISGLFVAIATGMKGPVALIALMGNGVLAFGLLIENKWKEGFISGFVWLFSFLLVYFVCISGFNAGVERTNGLMFLGITGSFDKNPWAIATLNELIENCHMPNNGITRIVALFLYILHSNIGAICLLIVATICELISIIKKHRLSLIDDALIMISIWGILLTIITYQDGHSQMYFIMSTFPFAILSGFSAMRYFDKSLKILPLLGIVLALMSFSDVKRFFVDRAYVEIKNGISARQGKQQIVDKRYCFTDEEYELSLWLKENTDSLDYIALDCFSYDGLRKEEGFGVFSERYIWNDGQYGSESEQERRRELVQRVFGGDEHDFSKLIEEGVRYLIQTLSQHENIIIDNTEIVYSSENYIIYKLY